MPEIDFGLAYEFVDPDEGVPRQLRFQYSGVHRTADTTGQLVAVVADRHRPDDGHTIAITRPDVTFAAVEAALDGWQTWAMVGDYHVNLAAIRRRIQAAGLH